MQKIFLTISIAIPNLYEQKDGSIDFTYQNLSDLQYLILPFSLIYRTACSLMVKQYYNKTNLLVVYGDFSFDVEAYIGLTLIS